MFTLPTETELQAALAVSESMGRDYPRISKEMIEAGLKAIEPAFVYRGREQVVRDIFIAMWRKLPQEFKSLTPP